MKKELKSGILSANKSADCQATVGGANVIAVLGLLYMYMYGVKSITLKFMLLTGI